MKEFHILNLGAGVQSTALYLMMFLGMVIRGEIDGPAWALLIIAAMSDETKLFHARLPRIDFAIFADTQDEPTSVYMHLVWLQSLGGPPILVRSAGKLSDDLMTGTRRTPLKEMRWKNG